MQPENVSGGSTIYLNVFTFFETFLYRLLMGMNSSSRLEPLLPSPSQSRTGDAHDVLRVARRLASRNPLQTMIGARPLSSAHECQPLLGFLTLPRMQSFTADLLLKCVFYLL